MTQPSTSMQVDQSNVPPPPPVSSCGLPQSAMDILMSAGLSINANGANNAGGPPIGSSVKGEYRALKKRFKFLVYENECYQEELRNLQRKLLKLSRDKNFLLDRLTQFEKLSDSSDDSDCSVVKPDEKKTRKRTRPSASRKRPTKAVVAPPAPSPSNGSISGNGVVTETFVSSNSSQNNNTNTISDPQITMEQLNQIVPLPPVSSTAMLE